MNNSVNFPVTLCTPRFFLHKLKYFHPAGAAWLRPFAAL